MSEMISRTSGTIRVLHVDDEPDFADLAATFLEREYDQFTVETATSPNDGLNQLVDTEFDCIISDYDMPSQNGIDFLEAVRNEYPDLPFILYTGKGSEEIASEAISVGVTDYLQKGSGTDQYVVLGNRVKNAVEQFRSQQALTKRNQELRRYKRMINSMREAACIYDSEGRFELVNEYLAAWYNSTPEELAGEQSTLIQQLREQADGDPFQDLLSGDRNEIRGELDNHFPGHGYAVLEYRLTPLRVDGTVEGVVGIARDITDRRERQAELERKDRAMDAAPVGITISDPSQDDNPLIYVNDRFTEVTGYPGEDVLGTNCRFLQGEHTSPETVARMREAIDNEENVTTELRNYRQDGTEFWNRVSIAPVYDDDGELTNYVGFQQDVTGEKEREQEFERTVDLLTQTEQIADVGGWEINPETEAVFWTDHLFEMLGVEYAEEPSLDEALDVYLEEDRPRVENAVEEAIAAGEPFDVEARFQRPDDEIRWFRIRGEPTIEDGEVVTLRGTVHDITHHKEREKRLEQTTVRLEALFENSPDMIDIHTTDGTIIDVNQQFCEAFDQPEDELVGQKVWEIDQEIDPKELRDMWDGMDVGDRTQLETEFETSDGTRFPVEVHLTRLPVDDGSRFMVISRDITERKQQIQEIQTLKERLELAIEGANLGVWDWDMRTDDVEFNDQWAEMLGYTLDELEPHLRTWESRVHPDDIDEVKAALEEHIQQETDYYDTEHRMRTADDEWKWIRDLGKIVERDKDDDPIRAVGIHLDIDESKRYQRALEEKTEELEELTAQLEEQYRMLFEEAPVMAVVTRAANGRPIIEDCNNQFAETLGLEPDALVGTELAEFYTPDSREELIDGGGYKRSLEGTFTKESRELVTADGEIVETLLRAVPRKDASGAVVGTLAMYIDITEREEVRRANERLEEFASIVSHDLRNPLSIASGHTELAREDCESPHLETVERAHDRMDVLIEDLLTLAREGEAVIETEAVTLSSVVGECWETVDTAGASLTIETDRTVVADESRLKQLFENLIRNAVEHGGSTVTVTVGGLADGFYIEDDGPGISENEAEAVFETGYSTNDGGTGFGLSIVQRIVEAHEWDIRVTNSSEGGARFEITGVEFTAE